MQILQKFLLTDTTNSGKTRTPRPLSSRTRTNQCNRKSKNNNETQCDERETQLDIQLFTDLRGRFSPMYDNQLVMKTCKIHESQIDTSPVQNQSVSQSICDCIRNQLVSQFLGSGNYRNKIIPEGRIKDSKASGRTIFLRLCYCCIFGLLNPQMYSSTYSLSFRNLKTYSIFPSNRLVMKKRRQGDR